MFTQCYQNRPVSGDQLAPPTAFFSLSAFSWIASFSFRSFSSLAFLSAAALTFAFSSLSFFSRRALLAATNLAFFAFLSRTSFILGSCAFMRGTAESYSLTALFICSCIFSISLTSGMASTLAFWDSNCAVISRFFASILAIAASASATAWASFVSFTAGGGGFATGFATANAGLLPVAPLALGLRASRCLSWTQRSLVGAKSQTAAKAASGTTRASDAATVATLRAMAGTAADCTRALVTRLAVGLSAAQPLNANAMIHADRRTCIFAIASCPRGYFAASLALVSAAQQLNANA